MATRPLEKACCNGTRRFCRVNGPQRPAADPENRPTRHFWHVHRFPEARSGPRGQATRHFWRLRGPEDGPLAPTEGIATPEPSLLVVHRSAS